MTTKQKNLTQHILPTSATMIGVCMTVITIVKLLHLGPTGTWIDKLISLDSLTFFCSASFSYLSIRHDDADHYERLADKAFMIGLIGMSACAVLLAFELV